MFVCRPLSFSRSHTGVWHRSQAGRKTSNSARKLLSSRWNWPKVSGRALVILLLLLQLWRHRCFMPATLSHRLKKCTRAIVNNVCLRRAAAKPLERLIPSWFFAHSCFPCIICCREFFNNGLLLTTDLSSCSLLLSFCNGDGEKIFLDWFCFLMESKWFCWDQNLRFVKTCKVTANYLPRHVEVLWLTQSLSVQHTRPVWNRWKTPSKPCRCWTPPSSCWKGWSPRSRWVYHARVTRE